jgi:hypothetical protein
MFSLSFTPKKQLFGYDVQSWSPEFLFDFLNKEKIKYLLSEEDNVTTVSLDHLDLHFCFSAKPSFFHVYINEKDFRIFDEIVIRKRKEELIQLFKSNGYPVFENVKDLGVGMLEFEAAGVTFFFENQFVDECVIEIY